MKLSFHSVWILDGEARGGNLSTVSLTPLIVPEVAEEGNREIARKGVLLVLLGTCILLDDKIK